MPKKKSIKSFKDLIVYQNLYKAMLIVLKEIAPRLPKEERFDLADQLRRACKAAPALIAEGFAKRYQKRQWKKYIGVSLCKKVIDIYDTSCKQLTKLGQTWQDYHDRDSRK